MAALCQGGCRHSYLVDKKNANLEIRSFVLYAHEKIEVTLNRKLILSDSNRTDSNKYRYAEYLKVGYLGHNNISVKSFYKGALVVDTNIAFADKFDKYLLVASAPYSRRIGLDSLNRMKFPYKLGRIPIEESARIVSVVPDTIDYNDVLQAP